MGAVITSGSHECSCGNKVFIEVEHRRVDLATRDMFNVLSAYACDAVSLVCVEFNLARMDP